MRTRKKGEKQHNFKHLQRDPAAFDLSLLLDIDPGLLALGHMIKLGVDKLDASVRTLGRSNGAHEPVLAGSGVGLRARRRRR